MGIEVENIRAWRGRHVVDPEGSRIGDLEAVYVDTKTDQPAFVTVTLGMIGRRRLAFVPLQGATVTPEHLRVRYGKDLVKDAPSIDTDGELPAAHEDAVFAHYLLDPGPGSGSRRLARR